MVSKTRRLVSGRTVALLFSTRDTVATDTFAFRATSEIVTMLYLAKRNEEDRCYPKS
jgi:hypothetical protein